MCSVHVVYSALRSAFVSVQIQCLLTNSCIFLRKIILVLQFLQNSGPYSQSKPHIYYCIIAECLRSRQLIPHQILFSVCVCVCVMLQECNCAKCMQQHYAYACPTVYVTTFTNFYVIASIHMHETFSVLYISLIIIVKYVQ